MKLYEYGCEQTFDCTPIDVLLSPGIYLIECYGAQGGKGLTDSVQKYHGGKGAYTSGILSIKHRQFIYLYIGGKGEDAAYPNKNIIRGGWNGGGDGKKEEGDDDDSGGGGGATDIRLIKGAWNDTESLTSRIMVAAGGSGSAYSSYGAPGGDLHGYFINEYNSENFIESDTNQTNGYKFGIGENGWLKRVNKYEVPYSGGGGGYYGGKIRKELETNDQGYNAVSSSGSSYISGHSQCNSISTDGLTHTNSNVHYSNLYFVKTRINNGIETFPNLYDTDFIKGKEGNGAVKITLLYTLKCSIKRKFIIPKCFYVVIIFK